MIADQVDRLVSLGVPSIAGVTESDFRAYAAPLAAAADTGDAVVTIHPTLVQPARLAPLLVRDGTPGFVVEDLVDLAEFVPREGVVVPSEPLYLIDRVERGDEMRNWSPEEALPAIAGRGRTPLTISEGISWLLQEPAQLEPKACFMCIGSRKPKVKARGGLDARTPALWISGGTGRDGKERKGAPKVGWCWAGNRHTWLGFASAAARRPAPAQA